MATSNRFFKAIRLAKKAFVAYKAHIAILVILGFLGGIFEGIGVNALIPLLSFILNESGGPQNIIVDYITRLFSFFGQELTVTNLLVFISVLFVLKAVSLVLIEYIKIRITTDYEQTTRALLYRKMLNAQWIHLLQQKLGTFNAVLLVDIPASAILLREIGTAIMVCTGLIVYILVALSISLPITLITLLLGVVVLAIMRPLLLQIKRYAHKVTNSNKDVAHHVNESVLGLKTIKAMNAADYVFAAGNRIFDKLKISRVNITLFKALTSSLIEPVSIIFISVVFVFLYREENFNFIILVAIIYLIHRIFIYIQKMESSLHTILELVPHLQSAVDYHEIATLNEEVSGGSKPFRFEEQLVFDKVHFQYPGGRETVLTDINFTIQKGEMVGLIGPSGAGKTTIVDLLLRLLTPSHGALQIDGVNAEDIDMAAWRKNIGYVSQDIFLMNDSIQNNIKFYDDTITDEQMIEAAKMANIDEFIMQNPQGYQTHIGDRGIMLSAGQRQRVVIARVLARQPQVLILDEATSALDNESELKIQEVIKSLHHKITVLVIAHRLSTVEDADRLIVLGQGVIQEIGSPAELLTNKESYFYKVSTLKEN